MSTEPPFFQDGDTVFKRASRELGRVEGLPVLDGGEYWYRVRFAQDVRRLPEDELEPLTAEDETIESLMRAGRWGRLEAFRCAMAVERISHENRSTVYAFNSQRILFQPYQYKPLLKVLDSPDRRILIADEVGLGKTIEAGLILAELEAREPIERVLIVCPSRLREKWRNELNRKFRQDFNILDRRGLEEYVRRATEDESRVRLRGIISAQTLRAEDLRDRLFGQVGSIDVVIVDEAHHARNPDTQTSKLLVDLCQIGEAVILLTATPLHLGMRDLHTLLHALRPTEFPDAGVFEANLDRHKGVIVAEAVARACSSSGVPQAARALRETFVDGILPGQRDPLAADVIAELEHEPPRTRREWLTMERRIQELHPLSSVLTRTRKRDVQETAPTRRAYVFKCGLTAEEEALYRQLVGGASGRGWIDRPVGLGGIQRARQAASCLPAAAAHRLGAASADAEDELSDLPEEDLRGALGADSDERADALIEPTTDSKFNRLREILKQIDHDDPGAKVIIFSFFVGTTKYLERRLTAEGYPAVRIAGDVPSDPQRPERDERGRRVLQFRDDSAIRVLVSSEVGSEGLDFQFAHHLVNYDLPWNPMVVEQRIGRIDRFGQKSPIVFVWNLVVEGTVEDRILHRLYSRIGIFEKSIGHLEAILGETMRELQREYVSGRLTPAEAERRVSQAERAVRERELDLRALEARASELFGHEEFIKAEMQRVRRLGRFVSEGAVLSLLRGFLEARHPETGVWEEERGIFGLRLTDRLRQEIHAAASATRAWIPARRGDELRFTTNGEIAFVREDVELVNVTHPLLRAAVAAMRNQLQEPSARVGQALLRLPGSEEEFSEGLYYVAVFAIEVTGIRPRRILEPIACRPGTGDVLSPDASERLLHLITEHGGEWADIASAPGSDQAVIQAVDREARSRYRNLRDGEKKENEARYLRRRRVVEADYQHRRETIMRKLRTAEARGRDERVLRLFEAQLEKRDADLRERLAHLDGGRDPRIHLTEPIAVCAVLVERTGEPRR